MEALALESVVVHGRNPAEMGADEVELHLTIARGRVRRARALIDSGTDVDAKDSIDGGGWTPLHKTAMMADRERAIAGAKLLLEKHAAVDARDSGGRTPLHLAAERGMSDIAELLLQAGASIGARDDGGLTALHLAAEGNRTIVAELLLQAGASIEARDDGGLTALHAAVRWARVNAVDFLLGSGAAVDATTDRGETALHLAAMRSLDPSVPAVGIDGGTIDYRATQDRIARRLLDGGAAVDAVDAEGWTPINRAARPRSSPRDANVHLIDRMLRETGALIALAQDVVDSHYSRERQRQARVRSILERQTTASWSRQAAEGHSAARRLMTAAAAAVFVAWAWAAGRR